MRHNLTLEQLGIDEDVLARFIGMSERPTKYLKYLDPEHVAEGLVELLGAEKALELIDRCAKQRPSSQESPPAGK